jgi:hypothetical protein
LKFKLTGLKGKIATLEIAELASAESEKRKYNKQIKSNNPLDKKD